MKEKKGRDDISPFVIHLTRDDKSDFEDGDTALNNLKSIIKSKTIIATRPHCMFNNDINEFDSSVRDKFNVACFTETPLSQIGNMTKRILGRKIKLESYGIVLKKELLIKSGAQQAIYINSYNGNSYIKESAREIFNIWKRDPQGKLLNILPFLNAMHEGYDFTWEREWRVSEDFEFKHSDIVAIILPEDSDQAMKEYSARVGVATISPSWNYEEIVLELASQQKKSFNLASLSGKAKKKKTAKRESQ